MEHFKVQRILRTPYTGAALVALAMSIPSCASAQPAMTITNTPGTMAHQGEPGAPYINTWLILGAFDNDAQNGGFDRDFIGGEAAAEPSDGQAVADRKWTYFDDRLFSRNYDDYNDLYSYFKVKQGQPVAGKVVYAHAYVYSPTAQSAQLRVGADTQFKAWINGMPVIGSNQGGPTQYTEGSSPLNSGRDWVAAGVVLKSGWNRLLLKVANKEAGRFGFYARLTDTEGQAVPGLIFSTGNGGGELTIASRSMPEAKTGDLPVAYREWSYFNAKPDCERLIGMGKGTSDANGQKPPTIPGIGVGFTFNTALSMQASPFRLTAQGGAAPYRWTKTGGTLPAGLSLSADGVISGSPILTANLTDYKFSVEVRDAKGKTARRDFTIVLRERPNRWVELARMTALIHGPERLPKEEMPAFANLMKRQGYGLAMPISYNNGDMLFRWPSSYGNKKTKEDVVKNMKAALEEAGVGFGMYMGNLNVNGDPNFTVNQQVAMVEEALKMYHPKALWFDWLGMDGTSLDSLFSMIHSFDPDIVIILNGSERLSSGDWDIIAFEGWNAWMENSWKMWPIDFPWPKKYTAETWRLSIEPGWSVGGGALTDWQDQLRVQLSLIGEGFIADMDHSANLAGSDATKLTDMELMKLHEKMAGWASPAGMPSLIEAYTNVDRGPLKAAAWGYNTINAKRDTIYLMSIKNPRGKTGLPAAGKITVGPIPSRIKSVTLMNSNKLLPFTQTQTGANSSITIDLKGVAADPIANVIKIGLATPLTVSQSLPPANEPTFSPTRPAAGRIPAGNLATAKPAWLMSADGTRELGPSGSSHAVYGVDGDPGTTAMAGWEYAWSYKVDLKDTYKVSYIVANFGAKIYGTSFQILTSLDGKDWAVVARSFDGHPGKNDFAITPTDARFIRVQAIKPDGPDQPGAQMGITELEVYEKAPAGMKPKPIPAMPQAAQVPPGNLATKKPSWLLSADGTRELGPSATSVAIHGTDGDPNTIAQAGGEYAWSYKVDLEEVQTFSRIVVNFYKDCWATDFQILSSNDGQEWKVIERNEAGKPGVNEFKFAPVKARYIRVQAFKPDAPGQTGAQMGITELQVFEK